MSTPTSFHNACRIRGRVCLDHSVPVYQDGIDIITDPDGAHRWPLPVRELEPLTWDGDQA